MTKEWKDAIPWIIIGGLVFWMNHREQKHHEEMAKLYTKMAKESEATAKMLRR